MVLVDVLDIAGDDLCEYDFLGLELFGLDGAVTGVTRSIDLAPYEELCDGLVLGGRGRVVAGVYGSE